MRDKNEFDTCPSFIDDIGTSCVENYAGISSRCVVIIEKADGSDEIPLEVIQHISEKYNIPIKQIYTDKAGHVGMKIDLRESATAKRLTRIPLIGHFEKNHSIILEPDHKPWYTCYNKKRKHKK